MSTYDKIFREVKEASKSVALLSDSLRNKVLKRVAELVDNSHSELLEANRHDLSKMDTSNPLYDRLKLTERRLDEISASLRFVASLSSPLGLILEERILPNDIELKKISVPFGVIGVIYEARPNVTFDVFSLCFKSGNAAILKGGSDAQSSNLAAIKLINQALLEFSLPSGCCQILSSSHDSTLALLNAVGYVDVCIPRGGKNLINFVRDKAKVPVIETGAGVVHVYFDIDGDLSKGVRIINNAKTRRVSVCNALDTLLIHSNRLSDLPALTSPLLEKDVEIFADERAFNFLKESYPPQLLHKAEKEDCDKEWMDYKLGIFSMDTLEEAINHIGRHGSGHSESIVTENKETAVKFASQVDAACVYINLPTSFTDGGEFGLGAEIGISTQKLGPRGPMGLKEITTYKYILSGSAQIRP